MLPLLFGLFVSLQNAAPPASSLELRVRRIIASSGAEVAVAYRTLDGRSELLIDPDKSFHAASTMKVPVMIELFRQAHARKLSLDDPLPIRNEFRSIVDGSPYRLSEGDDSDKDVYAAAGRTMTLRQLCEAMITVSSNFAANLLIERLGVENIRHTVADLGANGMQVLRGVEDQKAFDKGMNNTTTARGLLVLLESIAHGLASDAESDKAMVEILKRQKFNDAIPAGVPPGTIVAHKTGNITRIHHDAAIVYGANPYVLVLLVRGIEDQKQSAGLMAELSRAVYESAVERQLIADWRLANSECTRECGLPQWRAPIGNPIDTRHSTVQSAIFRRKSSIVGCQSSAIKRTWWRYQSLVNTSRGSCVRFKSRNSRMRGWQRSTCSRVAQR